MHNYLLQHLLIDSAGKFPDKEAVIDNGKSLTYSELDLRSGRLSHSLVSWGVEAGDRVGIMLDNSIESIISLFGILKAGAAYVPIDPQAPTARIEHIITSCEIQVLITSTPYAVKNIPDFHEDSSLRKILLVDERANQLKEQLKDLEVYSLDRLLSYAIDDTLSPVIADTSPAYILHTSGSTGMPKGVVITHRNSLTFVDMAADFFMISESDRLASHAPLHFDLSVFDIFVAIRAGATIVLVPANLAIFPTRLSQFINNADVTVWNSVASVLSLLAERGSVSAYPFDALRLVLFSGDILPVKYLRVLKDCFGHALFFNIYGQTEANSSTYYQVGMIPSGEDWKIPIGKPFPNFDVFALDENNLSVTRPGETGELYINSSSVALGYWCDEGKTSESFVADPRSKFSMRKVYKTGDLVRIEAGGDYVFVGRVDRQIKSRGYRIQLDEIEYTIKNHPSVKEAAVIAIPDELIGCRLSAYISPVEAAELTELDIFEHCAVSLPQYMIPGNIEFMDNLPRTATGKMDRNLLKKVSVNYASPQV
jgi:amino acid adenylation domain-containing protein